MTSPFRLFKCLGFLFLFLSSQEISGASSSNSEAQFFWGYGDEFENIFDIIDPPKPTSQIEEQSLLEPSRDPLTVAKTVKILDMPLEHAEDFVQAKEITPEDIIFKLEHGELVYISEEELACASLPDVGLLDLLFMEKLAYTIFKPSQAISFVEYASNNRHSIPRKDGELVRTNGYHFSRLQNQLIFASDEKSSHFLSLNKQMPKQNLEPISKKDGHGFEMKNNIQNLDKQATILELITTNGYELCWKGLDQDRLKFLLMEDKRFFTLKAGECCPIYKNTMLLAMEPDIFNLVLKNRPLLINIARHPFLLIDAIILTQFSEGNCPLQGKCFIYAWKMG